jgi:hypothetical protein
LGLGDLIDYAPAQCWEEQFPLYWQMTRAERYCLTGLLKTLRPKVSLEIGTYRGGSLQVLSRYSEDVVSIDIDPATASNLRGMFPNVAFRTGDSRDILPDIVREINASDQEVGFVLIDGDHSDEGVRRDVNAVLGLNPRCPMVIVIHDSFHPPCRAGMLAADWAASPNVQYVELDFIGGVFIPGRASAYHSMYGGFALALLLPEPRVGAIAVFESQRQLFEHARDAALAAESRAARTSGAVESRLRRSRSRLRALLATLTGKVKR